MIVLPRYNHVAARRLFTAGLACFAVGAISTPVAVAASGGASVAAADAPAPKAKSASTTTTGTRPKPIGKAQVKRAQLLLRVSATGKHDTATRKTVKRFQELRGIETYGIIDLPTYLEIKNAFALLETGGISVEQSTSAADGGGASPTSPAEPELQLPENLAEISAKERSILDKIAQCESKGNPRAISSNGLYRGKYQFDRTTWKTVGGSGDPAVASEVEQDQRAAILLRRRGTQPWPVCGRGLL